MRIKGSPEMSDRTDAEPLCMSVPEAGRVFLGLSRNQSYAAAKAGIIPVIRVGRLLKVPRIAMQRLLEQAGRQGEGPAL
jgi:hypothetical protein